MRRLVRVKVLVHLLKVRHHLQQVAVLLVHPVVELAVLDQPLQLPVQSGERFHVGGDAMLIEEQGQRPAVKVELGRVVFLEPGEVGRLEHRDTETAGKLP